MKKIKRSLDEIKENLNIKKIQLNISNEIASQHYKNYQTTCDEIKELKEKLKGNMSLIQERDIIWNDIIEQVKVIWDYMWIMVEDKTIVRDLEVIISSNKDKSQRSA